MNVDTRKLRSIMRAVAQEVKLEDDFNKDEIKKIAGFDVAFFDNKIVGASVVLDAKTLKVLERKTIVADLPMNYIPGYRAFREGPVLLQLYYELEEEPDIIMVNGHGIAHPLSCGLATFLGVELEKPSIGVAKSLLVGEEKEGKIILDNQCVGIAVKTKEYANPLYVSPGTKISAETAAEIIKKIVIQPHKLPEPLHKAHRLAKNTAKAKGITDVSEDEKTEAEILDDMYYQKAGMEI
ncbi:endonuclease V [Candidatus Woesearchaeota archaeon]|nr:endonuclease V [Candidatus Woesearchaeota archaeon]